MASELIITSARKGLDGGSGFQPVLRTRGMAPSLAERIRIRAGYSHPYTQGDARNPIVFVHRTERVGGENLHFLIRLADAGSDHTGRSNFLAHAIVLDSGEAKRKPAGPAETMRRFPFRTSWDEPSRESGSPTVIGGERPPSPCAAWRAAGLDPGIAGDLAEIAMKGETTRVVTRPGDDVLLLFADALALVAPAKRWQVTFTTCEIEPVEANWRAVRSDLPQSRGLASTPGVIDLSRPGARGSDSPYARYARGDAGTVLPWESATSPGSTVPPSPQNDGRSQSTVPPEDGTQNRDRFLEVDGNAGFDLGAAVRLPVVPPQSSVAPPHPGKRNLESVARTRANAAGTRKPVTFDRPESDPYLAIKYIGGGLLIVATCVGLYVFQSGWLATDEIPQARRAPIANESDVGEQFARNLSKDAVERDRRDSEAEQARKATEQKEAAERELAAQQEAQKEQETKAAREAEEEQARKATASATARHKAFADIALMPDTIRQDLPIPGGTLDDSGLIKPIDLGPFDYSNLSEVNFRLAYPVDEFAGQSLLADIHKTPEETTPTWRIESRTQTPDGPSQQLLARLINRGGQLLLEPSDDFTKDNWRFALMRRSVLLVIAADPGKPGVPPRVVREIRLVRPGTGQLQLTMDPTQSKATSLEMGPHLPKSISWSPDRDQVILPQVGCRIHYAIQWAGAVIPIAPGKPHGVFDSAMKDIEVRLGDRPLTITRLLNKRVSTISLGVLAARLKVSFPQGFIKLQPTLDGPAVPGDPFEYLRNWSRFDGNKSEREIEASNKALQHMLEGQQGPQWETAIAQLRSILSNSYMTDEVKELEQAVNKLKEDQQKIPPVASALDDFRKAVGELAERAIRRVPEVRDVRNRLTEKVVLTVSRIESEAVSGDEVYSVPLFVADGEEGKERPGDEATPTAVVGKVPE